MNSMKEQTFGVEVEMILSREKAAKTIAEYSCHGRFPFLVIGRLYGMDGIRLSSMILLHIHGVLYPASAVITFASG